MIAELYEVPPANSRNTWAWATPFLLLILFIGGQLLVLFPADALGLITEETVQTYPTVLYLIVGSFSMVLLLLVLWILLFERRGMPSVGVSFNSRSITSYVRAFCLGLLMGATVVGVAYLFGAYEVEPGRSAYMPDMLPILILLFAFMLQSFTEEVIFRGWMMSRIASRYGLWAGIIGNSVLFTLMHIENDDTGATTTLLFALFTAITFVFSVFLSLLAARQKSVMGASAWHAAWNWVFITWFGLPTTGIELGLSPLITDLAPVPGAPVWLAGGLTGPEGSVVTLLVLCVACVPLLLCRVPSYPISGRSLRSTLRMPLK